MMDNILQERMAKIKAKAVANEDKKRNEEEEKQRQYIVARESIIELSPRICNLLDLANACLENKIVPYKRAGSNIVGGSRNFFEADGIFHHLGFDRGIATMGKVRQLMIINGGWNGNIDLRVGGDGVAQGYLNSDNVSGSRYVRPRTEDMQKFLKEFDNFEKEFLSFIDSL